MLKIHSFPSRDKKTKIKKSTLVFLLKCSEQIIDDTSNFTNQACFEASSMSASGSPLYVPPRISFMG